MGVRRPPWKVHLAEKAPKFRQDLSYRVCMTLVSGLVEPLFELLGLDLVVTMGFAVRISLLGLSQPYELY